MSHLPSSHVGPSQRFRLALFAISIGLALTLASYGQVSQEEHAKHHPGQAKDKDKAGMPGMLTGDKVPAKGMGGGMEGMMDGMGKPPPKELYPTLMSLPDLTPEQREQIRSQADERMRSGVALLSEGLEKLAAATEIEDYRAMQDATDQMREAVARFESGLAAKRALAEGKPPRQVAMQWFKGEMSLQPPGVEARGSLFGVAPIHFFTCVLLIAFALAMVAMYYFKMRRAAALFGRIEADKASPPPGSAPPLAGSAGPSVPAAPAGEKTPPPAADAEAAPPAAEGP